MADPYPYQPPQSDGRADLGRPAETRVDRLPPEPWRPTRIALFWFLFFFLPPLLWFIVGALGGLLGLGQGF